MKLIFEALRCYPVSSDLTCNAQRLSCCHSVLQEFFWVWYSWWNLQVDPWFAVCLRFLLFSIFLESHQILLTSICIISWCNINLSILPLFPCSFTGLETMCLPALLLSFCAGMIFASVILPLNLANFFLKKRWMSVLLSALFLLP